MLFFNIYVNAKDFNDLDLKARYKIDSAVLVDKNSESIKTPFGVCATNALSSGCKTILSFLYLYRNISDFKDIILSITECGINALELLFDYADDLNCDSVTFLLMHSDYLYECRDRNYVINGVSYKNINEGVILNG